MWCAPPYPTLWNSPPLKTEGDTISRLPFCSQSGSSSTFRAKYTPASDLDPILHLHCIVAFLDVCCQPQTISSSPITHPQILTWYGQEKRYSWLDQHYHHNHHYDHHGQRYLSGKIPNVGCWGESESQVKAAKHFTTLLFIFIIILLFNIIILFIILIGIIIMGKIKCFFSLNLITSFFALLLLRTTMRSE